MSSISRRAAQVRVSGTREVFDAVQGLSHVISLGIGQPDFETPHFVRRAALAAIRSGRGGYTSSRGMAELRREIARKLRRENGVRSDPDREVMVTGGSSQAIFLAMSVVIDVGDEVVIPSPAFSSYRETARLAGGTPVEVPLRQEDYDLDVDKITKSFSRKTKVLVLNSPNNPTGAVFSRDAMMAVCTEAVRRGIHIISDEVYEKFVYDGLRHFSPGSVPEFRDRTITVGSFSKTFAMTGWRLGYAAASDDVIDAMSRFNLYNATCPNYFTQVAGMAALRASGSFFNKIRREFERRRDMAHSHLTEIGLEAPKPKGAFYILPSIAGTRLRSEAFCKRLLAAERVATVPGISFGMGGEGRIRISYAINRKDLGEALGRLARFCSSPSRGTT